MATIGEVFPHEDCIARFVVAMGMAANDVKYCNLKAAKANDDDDDPAFHYLTRLAFAHTFEALYALQAWRNSDAGVRKFLDRLPEEAKAKLKQATDAAREIGGELEHARNRTFHYPYPSAKFNPDADQELVEILEALSDEEAVLGFTISDEGEPTDVHLDFAEKAALLAALHKYDASNLKEQIVLVRDASLAFHGFASHLVAFYLDDRGISFGTPRPAD